MKIVKIKVENYRLLKTFELDLEKDLSVVIGKNNSGKTSLLSILEKFIGKRSSSNSFTYDDFNIDFQKHIQHIITTSLDSNSYANLGISLTIIISYDETDNLANISKLMMDLNPCNNYIVLKYEYTIPLESLKKIRTDYLDFTREKEQAGKPVKSINEYLKDTHNRYFIIGKKALGYDPDNSKVIENEHVDLLKENHILDKVINFKLISAKRNVTNNDSDRTLSALSSKYYEKKEDKENEALEIQNFKEVLSSTDLHLNKIYDGLFVNVIDKVKKFGGISKGDSIIKIASTLQHRELLKGNTTVMYHHDMDHSLPENYNGLGYLNLITMIFEIEILLSEFRKESNIHESPADINLLFIEEPEAHTHPQMQYVFIKNIKEILNQASQGIGGEKFNLQTLITTHSSHITSECDFNDIKYFCRTDRNEVCSKNLKDLEKEYENDRQAFKFLKQYLTLNRAELFFVDKAIFIEGDTERILLPAFMKKIDQEFPENPLLSQNISIVEVGAYSHIFEKFINFISIKALIITDIDSAKITLKKDITGKVSKELKKCKVQGKGDLITTNSSLNFFFATSFEFFKKSNSDVASAKEPELVSMDIGNTLDFLKSLDLRGKSLIKDSKIKKWVQKDDGNLLVIFQTPEKNSSKKTYHARSFEDAFIHLNQKFITENEDQFKSLKNRKYFKLKSDPYFLAENCIDKKPNFAMDVLLNSRSENGIDFCNWMIPAYIKEGLLWLKN
ncbi:ATP-dependent nuclease [Paenibacillus sp. CAU 1782]